MSQLFIRELLQKLLDSSILICLVVCCSIYSLVFTNVTKLWLFIQMTLLFIKTLEIFSEHGNIKVQYHTS